MSKNSPLLPVYPRWRGEHVIGCGAVAGSPGLSPLARGTLSSSCIWRQKW
ncbi:hypothetical protein SEET535_18460, partial [Salmonella enterica subsp. enterica serovar Tennessee str. 4535]